MTGKLKCRLVKAGVVLQGFQRKNTIKLLNLLYVVIFALLAPIATAILVQAYQIDAIVPFLKPALIVIVLFLLATTLDSRTEIDPDI